MFLEMVVAIAAGIILGSITGLTPGLHINAVSVLIVSFSPFLLAYFSSISLGIVIISMGVTHTFLDTIPSIFLGAPDAETALAVLPGHRMLLAGKGFEAVKLTIIGSLFSLLLSIILMPALIPVIPLIYDVIKPYIGIILILACAYMIYTESTIKKKILGTLLFFLSGILGYVILNFPNLNQPLFPLLSGLFGISLLLVSLSEVNIIPKQRITNSIWIGKKGLVKSIAASVISGSASGFLPGLGSSQAAIIALALVREAGLYTFLIIIGGINTVNFLVSLATFYAIDKARNGAIVAMTEIIPKISIDEVILFMAVALIAGSIASIITLEMTVLFSKLISRINYRKCCLTIIIFVTAGVIYSSSGIGLLVLLVSTTLGIAGQLSGVKKSLMMGCLILPVIIYFLG
ncbi:tripartite tricarboxylate transporter permease [Candidatus Woesearchaeota archaeon]|nr:tripartite tricarboxylate transporter permease [Candidatus Woesearchaeota archaeon]